METAQNHVNSEMDQKEEATREKFTIPIHSTIYSMQKQHGIIPHQDYTQYRQYCTRKIHRLRHAKDAITASGRDLLHGSGGRGKHASTFQPRRYLNKTFEEKTAKHHEKKGGGEDRKDEEEHGEMEEEMTVSYDKVHHVNFLLILLTNAERCWSCAMELKTEYDVMASSTGGRGTGPGVGVATLVSQQKRKKTSLGKLRKQFHSKLRKAAEYATALRSMAVATADESTIAECQAYASWMRGNIALEKSAWDVATKEYSEALAIIQVLSQSVHNLEMQDYFSSRAEFTIEPLMAYCQYELLQSSGSDGAADNVQELLNKEQQKQSQLMSRLLQSKLEGERDKTRRAEATKSDSKYGSVTYRGVAFPVDSEELRMVLCKIDELVSSESADDSNFVQLLSAYDDAILIVSSELKELEKMASGKHVNATKHTQRCLLGYIQHQKLSCLMDRNENMASMLRDKGKSADFEGDEPKMKRMEELAHMYSLLLQDARMVASLPTVEDVDDAADGVEVEDDFALEANAHVLRFRAFKCYYAAHIYTNNGKASDATMQFVRWRWF